METLIFLIFAVLAVASSLVVVAHKSPVYATMSLVLTLFSVAVLFVLLGAPFLGALQILVYAGAIVVLFLFVIMLLNLQKSEERRLGPQLGVAMLGALIFVGMVGLVFWRSGAPALQRLTPELVSLKGLATALFADYLLPFEIVGLLLLVAVVGATVAARKAPEPGAESGLLPREDYVSGDEPRTDPLRSLPDPRRPDVAEPAYKPAAFKEAAK
ncbi:MAG: NADH-quinone oxidoreductase subunit [Acidobacteriota bacterium]|jgi:NADH-quinone oxidoreductase subunit J|nr:NADH-quinone oxidoreductase subunit [Acidobacteriota bacterium]